MDWNLLFMVLGLALILEGVPYFLSPRGALKTMRQLEQAGPLVVRILGLGAMLIGVALLLLGRYLGG